MGLWLGLMGAAAAGSVAMAAQGDDPARNQCRAACASTWVTAQVCAADKTAITPVSPIRCRQTADRRYKTCLAACEPAAVALQSQAPAAKAAP